jgi:tripartite-type tricarboxylate transporter receptor subunit TctC
MKKAFSLSRLFVVLVCSLSLVFLSAAMANAWQPDKPVEFVVPAGTGGGADVMARFVSPLISKYNLSPKPFIVINKSGGAGAEGFMYVKGKKGDPHVVIVTLSNLFTTPMATGVPFNWKDLTPLARLALDGQGIPGRRQKRTGKIHDGGNRDGPGRSDYHHHVGTGFWGKVYLCPL